MNLIKPTLRIYKWSALLFVVVYLIIIVIDDFVFIRKIDSFESLGIFLMMQGWFLVAYFLVFTFFFVMASVLVIIGLKVFMRMNKTKAERHPTDQ